MALRNYRWLMRETEAESYEDVSSWGQASKGIETLPIECCRLRAEPPVVLRGLTEAGVAREVAAFEGIGYES